MACPTVLTRIRACQAAIVLLAFSHASVQAAPATFNTALPVSEGHAVARQQLIVAQAERGNDRVEETTAETVLGYGMTPDLAVFVAVPWVDREFEPAVGENRGASGIGDMRAFARYTLVKRDQRGQTLRIAPFVGVELPTGKDRVMDLTGLLPPGLQPGSGSLDVFGGAVASLASTEWNLDGQLVWQENREANARARGDVFKADFSLQKRLLPAEPSANTRGWLFGGLELNYINERRSRLAGVPEAGSGKERLFLTPVLQYSQTRWMAEVAVQIPVTQNIDDANFSHDPVVRIGFRVNI